jgi:putative FmdB family regulatory protein
MPLYSFLCDHDGTTIDHEAPMGERDYVVVVCPHCGKRMKRVPTSAMAVLWAGLWHDPSLRNRPEHDGLGPGRGF